MRRRPFLAAAGTALVAGCTDALPGGSTPTPTESPSPTPTPGFRRAEDPGFAPGSNPYASEYDRAGGFELERGEYAVLPVQAPGGVVLRYAFEVTRGSAIDVLVMKRPAFRRYEGGADQLAYLGDASEPGRRQASREAPLGAGDYVVVFDNTERGPTDPDGAVRVRYGLSAVPRFRQAPDPGFSPASNPFSGAYARSGGLALDRGTYKSFSLSVDRQFTLRYAFEVREGGPLDAYLMGTDAFGRYANERSRFPFYSGASRPDATRGSVTKTLPAGEHVLVFDNTHLGTASPDGPARLVYGLGFGSDSN